MFDTHQSNYVGDSITERRLPSEYIYLLITNEAAIEGESTGSARSLTMDSYVHVEHLQDQDLSRKDLFSEDISRKISKKRKSSLL